MHRLPEQQATALDHRTGVDADPHSHPADRPRLGQDGPLHLQRRRHGPGGILERREPPVALALLRRQPAAVVADRIRD